MGLVIKTVMGGTSVSVFVALVLLPALLFEQEEYKKNTVIKRTD